MRILHVNKFLYRRGGAESYMLDVAEMQREAGHTVEFFSMSHPDNEDARYATSFAPYMELGPPPTGAIARLRTAANIVWSPAAQRGIAAVIDDFEPDVAHLHNIYHQLSPSILRALRRRGIPTVMTLHDYKLACTTYLMLDHGTICDDCVGHGHHHAFKRRCNNDSAIASAMSAAELAIHTRFRAYGPVDVFICPSQFMLDTMCRAGVFPDRQVHVEHFAHIDDIAPATAPGRAVLFAGRLAIEKGVDTLIDAIALAPDLELTILGDGPERESLTARAEAKAPGRIRFVGRVDAATVHATMRDSAVVTIPSRWHENQPMVILEAYACGRPVVGTALGGIPELISDPDDGRLVPHEDPAALAAALQDLANDPAGAHEMGMRGRQRVIERFSPKRHLAELDRVYERAGATSA